ncbi:hypothetical protein AAFF_G00034160 [Aldrovandia affinis]|uniref:MARVEL domain-containing protein n=1 Tax=Aldrovandia affinis TaxID=143900 RepID=A0AAD7S3C2_9TELE|nr:hypothetical protein AAFF_G00034160 [Aldrovandia affinis]
MASGEAVYNTTTMQETKPKKWFLIPTEYLDKVRFVIKVVEVLLSVVAFVLEELVDSCLHCPALYFLEFVSCTAFLFTLLLLVLLSTNLHRTVEIHCWSNLDLVYTAAIACLFPIASITLLCSNGGTELEMAAAAFGIMAAVAFVTDVVVHIKTKGVPFCKRNQETQSSDQSTSPEKERLDSNGESPRV